MSESNSTEVQLKLILNASEAEKEMKELVEEFKQRQGEVAENAKKKSFWGEHDWSKTVKSAGAGVLTTIGAMAGGFLALGGAAAKFGHDSIEAFSEDQAEIRAMAGAFALIDDGTHSMEQLRSAASDVAGEVSGMVARTGVAGSDLVAAFTDIADRGYMSADAAREFTEEMAYAGKAIPGGMAAIATGMDAIQAGMVKAKNPIVAMIASTGTLQGTTKEVAKEMAKMSLDKQMDLAQKAVRKMADQMREVPLSIAESMVVLNEAKDVAMEAAGKPIVTMMEKEFGNLRSMFFDVNGEQTPLMGGIVDAATEFGDTVGDVLGLGKDFVGGIVDGSSAFNKEIKDAKEAFFGKDGIDGMAEQAKFFGSLIGKAGSGLVLAVTSVAGILTKVIHGIEIVVGTIMQKAGTMLDKPGWVQAGKEVEDSAYAGENAELLKKMRDPTKSVAESEMFAEQYRQNRAKVGLDANEELQKAVSDHNSMATSIGNARGAVHDRDAYDYGAEYTYALEKGNEGASRYIAGLILTSESMADAMASQGPEILKGGRDKFLEELVNMATPDSLNMAERLKASWKVNVGGAKADKPINFNGTTIKIQQDFKDQDPDRIAAVFTNVFTRSANAHVSSKLSPGMGF